MDRSYEAFSGPVIGVFSFFGCSREPRRTLGALCAVSPVVVSIASSAALDTRSNERCVRAGFVLEDKAFAPTSKEVGWTSFASALIWLLPEQAEATGVAESREGRAALAAPTVGAIALADGSLGAGRARGGGRCDGAP